MLALARRFGRDDDVRVLNFMVASGLKDSHCFNPFAIGNADAIRELLASQLGDQTQNDPNGVFRERAVALIGTIAPVLVWLRDHKGIALNIEVIRFSIELRWIWKLAMEKIVLLRDPETGAVTELDVSSDIPEDITWPLRSYLGELPGYDPAMPLDKQKGDEPSKQHGYAQFYFTATFTQLAVSLGHIFRVDIGDIDMRDVVLNRRILVVNLPALENSDATLAALGKLVVASLRGMMAQLLGASLEGDYTEADKPGMGLAPFPVVLDELAYYATSGLDRMLAMGAASTSASCSDSRRCRASGRGSAKRPPRCSATPTSRSQCASRTPAAHASGSRRPPDRPTSRRPPRITAPPTALIARRAMPRYARSRASTGTTLTTSDRGRGNRAVRRAAYLRPGLPCHSR